MKLASKKIISISKKILLEISKKDKIKMNLSNKKFILLGDGSALDSIAFVNFITRVEQSVSKELKKDFSIKLDKIHKINKGKSKLYLNDFNIALAKLI